MQKKTALNRPQSHYFAVEITHPFKKKVNKTTRQQKKKSSIFNKTIVIRRINEDSTVKNF